jgi:myo-inositol-1(or 4)-monophosphatase
MSTINYQQITSQIAGLARETGLFIKKRRSEASIKTESKGKNDFVTQFDKESEARIVKALELLLPEAGFIAEENTSQKQGVRFTWIIDPIDGTTNFIHGLSPYCISIALMENKEIVSGVIYEAGLDECFTAWKGGPAQCNGNNIKVTDCAKVADSLIATGFPYSNFSKMEPFIQSLQYFMENCHGMRRLGSAAADLAYVACGRFDAFYEYDLKPWDVAAGAFLVQQAGGRVCDFKGGDNYLFGREMIAGNSALFNEFSTKTRSFLES